MKVPRLILLGICSLAIFGSNSLSQRAEAQTDTAAQFTAAIKGLKQVSGMWTLYHNDQKLLLHLKTTQLNKNYIVIPSIARGISSGMVLGGMSWDFGDDAVWSFRKVGEKVHVLRRNVRYKAKKDTPEANAVKLAYSDSVLYALPIKVTANGGYLLDLTSIFMSDDQQIGSAIGSGFRFVSDRSTWAKVAAYPKNMELQVAAVYSGGRFLETVADPRGVQVRVHYSISELPASGYKPREADDRVGYFMSVLKDFSEDKDDQHFVRYINRWRLEKADPKAALSPPKDPIIFYMEKTVPIRLRPYVQEGIEEWNKAFEKIGFSNAIQVRQQREDDNWDPEDIRYNTFRWITAEAGFAMGPSRKNPFTGEILDADIIFDASFLRYWKSDYETLADTSMEKLMGYPTPKKGSSFNELFGGAHHGHSNHAHCTLCNGMQHQMSFSAAALMAQGVTNAKGKLPDEFVFQALKEVVMHEVGHTLGLRHNFKASSWKSMKQINEAKDKNEATVASVMDYAPANIALKKENQGLYYTPTLGPYDYWAIEYGYKTFESKEEEELKKIASRGAESGLDYATDEDTRSVDSDPLSNRFDLGQNPLNFVEQQMTIASTLLPKVVERSVNDGDGYQRARQAFGMLFSEYWRSALFAARFPGGVYVHRDHKGDNKARPPFKLVESDRQRQAMKLIAESAFAAPSYDPDVLNYLAATRWSHWGMNSYTRLDYPIHDVVDRMQGMLLSQLLSRMKMERILDSELKVKADQDVYTLAEHFRFIVESIFTEWKDAGKGGEFTNRKPYIASFRRNLQRRTLKEFARMVSSAGSGPEDARTLARLHLMTLNQQIEALLKNNKLKLDDYSKAHLLDSQNRIKQVLETRLIIQSVQ